MQTTKSFKKWLMKAGLFLFAFHLLQVRAQEGSARERICMDQDWLFSFGHPSDPARDYNTGTGYFSWLAKAAYGDGAAAADFDDRAWRKLDLPHDWAVELPFDPGGSLSHGFKAIGRKFPENSLGWYRKHFFIPQTDAGKRISIQFDGVYRNFSVWVNGFYLGTEPSGYTGVEYNLSEYLNYGGQNTIAVRVDASMEEGWFYEGAGIYRHVWLQKTAPLHVATHGSFVTTDVHEGNALVRVSVTVANEQLTPAGLYIQHKVIDFSGKEIASAIIQDFQLQPWQKKDLHALLSVQQPRLWSPDTPSLYTLVTELWSANKLSDRYTTVFGIRTIRFDPDSGFFLNGKHIKIKGTNNHQDHAGVGAALPDALQVYRIRKLKELGANAYRTSHNPPTPELLDICDSLGMLVIDENRLMGVSAYHVEYLKRFMVRDRNHPSVISWSIGNEEWGIEGNEKGARIAQTMEAFARTIDSTRGITAAISGGWQSGISNVIGIMGVNYIGQIDTDEHHRKFPRQPMWGTEEGSTRATRGIYRYDTTAQWIPAYDARPYPHFKTIEEGWKHYMARDYLAGMFIWTGFDYRGEPTPFGWPSVTSYFGMYDLCGFPKDNVWYLKSWWTRDTILHILPHWNWKGEEGKRKDVWVYSNCEEVELLLNGKSLGRKKMPLLGHLEWETVYQPGVLEARGFRNGKRIALKKMITTGWAAAASLTADRTVIQADGKDISVISVAVKDRNGLHIPDAAHMFNFSVTGPGRIIGVGNGNPTSLEAERFIENIQTVKPKLLSEKMVSHLPDTLSQSFLTADNSGWGMPFAEERDSVFGRKAPFVIYKGHFVLPEFGKETSVTFFSKSIGREQALYINGHKITGMLKGWQEIPLSQAWLKPGENSIVIVAVPLLKDRPWDEINKDPGTIRLLTPAPGWRRKLFSGYAQVLLQSTGEAGDILLTATAEGLPSETIRIKAELK